ncbi:PH domain-containing protein [Nakamurella deserti]|uniref:PH domain-containing protein n=1 Tax=Nakamurella deserti TaxID=2164074 RepID=UPI000DBE373B|nr:PH domain-containing protein [Nakamurella deserti]
MPAPDKAVFRLPTSALFIPLGLFVFATPLAAASVWTLPLYLLPLYGLLWVLITRTVADDRTIEAHLPLRTRRIPWADLDGFEFQGPRWAIAVTQEGRRIRLPMVRPRDLRRLAEVSGGRLYLGEDAAARAEEAADASSASTSLKAGAAAAADTGSSPATPPVDAVDPQDPQTVPGGPVDARPESADAATDGSSGSSGTVADAGPAGPTAAAHAASSDDAGRRAPRAE